MKRTVLLALLSMASPLSVHGQTNVPSKEPVANAYDVEERIRIVLTAKAPQSSGDKIGAADAYRSLFKLVGTAGLRNLEVHSDDGIAVQAAWQQVKLGLRQKKNPEGTALDKGKLARFIGFLEGRMRLEAPNWWSELLLESRASGAENVIAQKNRMRLYHATDLDYVRAPINTTLEIDKRGKELAQRVILRVGDDSIRISENLLRKSATGKFIDNISVLLTPTRCYIAAHDGVGYSYELACIDRKSNQALWKSDVWATFSGVASGDQEMFVGVTEQSGRVVVFGASYTGFHVEAFRSTDGAPLFRFSSPN